MSVKIKFFLSLLICVIILVLAVGIGSVSVHPMDTVHIILHKIFGIEPGNVKGTLISIVWVVRLPRVLVAFTAGAALAVSGSVMQSVLKNPLASSFTLGVSSGAAFGVAFALVTGFTLPFFAMLSMPLTGLFFGLATVFIVIAFSQKVDKGMGNQTIILAGIVFSLFINAVLSLMTYMSRQNSQRIIFWQMGSFEQKSWTEFYFLLPVTIICIIILFYFSMELDIMSFGAEQAQSLGVSQKKAKWLLIAVSSAMTGCCVAFVGIIGFVDLIAPHIARKILGSKHKYVIPGSALFGGSLMVLSDLISRTIAAPSIIPVGSVTAIIGTPFFCWVFFIKGKK